MKPSEMAAALHLQSYNYTGNTYLGGEFWDLPFELSDHMQPRMTSHRPHVIPTATRQLEPELSVVVPCYNEQDCIEEFNQRLLSVLQRIGCSHEIIYINDGSSDATLNRLVDLQRKTPAIGIIDLSRNFGKEAAVTSGLEHALGAAVVVIDADLQDPPEVICELVQMWVRTGADVVYAKRRSRSGETVLKRVTSSLFYRLMHAIADHDFPTDTGDFRLLSRRALDALLQLPERRRFMKGLFSWIGYTQVAVEYDRDRRYAGTTKWNYWKLWNFSLEGITSFSTLPLRLSTYVGLSGAAAATGFAIYMFISTLLYGNPVAGYPSLIVIVLMIGSVQLLVLGVMGEYIGRVFVELKQRPVYLMRDYKAPSRRVSSTFGK